MGQRSTLCTRQMFDLDSEPSDSCLHRDYGFTRNASDYTNRNSHSALSGPGNSGDLFHQLRDYHERIMLHGNQYNIQNFHTIQNLGLGVVAPLNIYNSNMLLAPADRNLPVHQSNVMAEHLPSISQSDNGINLDEFGSHNHLVDVDRRPCKRKDTEMIPGIYNNLNGSASSSSTASYHSNCGVPTWGQSFESVPNIMDPISLTPLEYGRRAPLPAAEGSHRSVRSRSVTGSLQPESAVRPHQNCLLPGSYMVHPFQPINNAWVSQFGNGNNIVNGGINWNYNNNLRYLQGRSLIPGRLPQANTNIQAYTGNSSATNSAMLLHPSSIPNFHPAAHNLQVHGYSHHGHIPAPYQHPVNNLGSINSNLSGDGMDVGSTFPHFPTGVDQIYRPMQLPQPAQQIFSRSLRLLSAEDAALMDLSEFYEVVNSIDQHEDMRLDIDDMSYEELLALEEHIGVVETGLSEDFIIKHLKMRAHVPQETALSLEPSTRLSKENETCSICQVEYEEDEIIGSLDCGHAYHADCIKQWLLIKNLCPICKTSALDSSDRRELK